LQVEELERRRQQAEDRWEQLVGVGGGTFTVAAKCPQCGGAQAAVHNIQSGGTYAQERVPIQKYVCTECHHAWKVDV
jgi:transposase-like protein